MIFHSYITSHKYRLKKEFPFPNSRYTVEAKINYKDRDNKEITINLIKTDNDKSSIGKFIACSAGIDCKTYDYKANKGFTHCFSQTTMNQKIKRKFLNLIPIYYKMLVERFDRHARI